MIDIEAARARAWAWLKPGVTRETAINEELVAIDLLDALDEVVRLRALTTEACGIADDLNGDNGDDEELARRKSQIAEIRQKVNA